MEILIAALLLLPFTMLCFGCNYSVFFIYNVTKPIGSKGVTADRRLFSCAVNFKTLEIESTTDLLTNVENMRNSNMLAYG